MKATNFLKNRFVILAVLLAGGLTAGYAVTANASNQPSHGTAKDYQAQLQNSVDTTSGEPRDGRNPAGQNQTSLAEAASRPNGVGQRTDKPAANVHGEHKHVDPADVLPKDLKVDTRPKVSVNRPAACNTNSRLALQGIQVAGANPFVSDNNTDFAACNTHDLAASLVLKTN